MGVPSCWHAAMDCDGAAAHLRAFPTWDVWSSVPPSKNLLIFETRQKVKGMKHSLFPTLPEAWHLLLA